MTRVLALVTLFRHTTWSGRVCMVWLPIRGLFVAPALEGERCIMGYPVDPAVRCPRRRVDADGWAGLWCARHQSPDRWAA